MGEVQRIKILYMRVSDYQKQDVASQEIGLMDYVRRQDWQEQELLILKDYGSGKISNRTNMDKAMELVVSGQVSDFVVPAFDRCDRNLRNFLQRIDTFQRHGVRFISLRENVDSAGATGRLFLQLLGAFAEFERNLISERTRAGLVKARLQGKKLGRPSGKIDKRFSVKRQHGAIRGWMKRKDNEQRHLLRTDRIGLTKEEVSI